MPQIIINLKDRISDNFGDPILELFKILEVINTNPDSEIVINLSDCEFSYPFILTAISVLNNNNERIIINANCKNPAFSEYLKYINFFIGMKPDELNTLDFANLLLKYETKTYIPIINFPVARNHTSTLIRDRFLSSINQLIYNQLKLKGEIKNAVSYLIDESVVNIVDHSLADRGFIFAQYYPTKNFMDVCIADGGIGVLNSYINNRFEGISNSPDAIISAVNGQSTKDDGKGRGYGIRTSKEMLVNGLKGKYFLLTGNGFIVKNSLREEIISLPESKSWNGTIISLRIPILNNSEFIASDYYQV